MNVISKLTCLFLLLPTTFFSIGQQANSVDTVRSSMVIQGPLWGAVWHQRGSEYKALCFQAYNIGHWRLDLLLKEKHAKPLAIVTDIDETVLDNSPFTIHQALRDS